MRVALTVLALLATVAYADDGAELVHETMLAELAELASAAQADSRLCEPGTVFWERDSTVAFCASVCFSDSDCDAEGGRCRVLAGSLTANDDVLLVEDLDGSVPVPAEPVLVCDPFWDFTGATDTDLDAVENTLRHSVRPIE